MSDPSEILKRRLRAVIDGTQTPGGLHFFAQIGGPMHDLGMTTLQVSGTGAVVLGWRQDEDRLLYSYVLSNVDQVRFYTMLLDLPFWETNTTRRNGKDDEQNIHIRLSDQEAGTYNGIQCWHTDLDQHPVIGTLLFRLYKLIGGLSDNEIPRPTWVDDI